MKLYDDDADRSMQVHVNLLATSVISLLSHSRHSNHADHLEQIITFLRWLLFELERRHPLPRPMARRLENPRAHPTSHDRMEPACPASTTLTVQRNN